MKKKTTKKRNPQDATLTNIRALKKRVAELEKQVRILGQTMMHLESRQITQGATEAWVGQISIDPRRAGSITILDRKGKK